MWLLENLSWIFLFCSFFAPISERPVVPRDDILRSRLCSVYRSSLKIESSLQKSIHLSSSFFLFLPLLAYLSHAALQVLPIELPGRNSRRSEPAETCLIVLAQKIADVIESFLLYR